METRTYSSKTETETKRLGFILRELLCMLRFINAYLITLDRVFPFHPVKHNNLIKRTQL